MTNPLRLRLLAAVLTSSAFVSACTSEPEMKMTPEKSRQVFIAEAKAIIQAVFPDADPLVVVQVKDSPCGGPVGTEHTSVKSAINVHSDAADKHLNPDDVFQKVLTVLRQRGWTVNYSRTRVAGAERAGVGGISAGVGESPVGINIFGDTECVKSPDE
ncbi:hypothetical protein [Microbispora bryophytorum]|uniref:Lipoprotein n=1 Tax=Microbispora bryophytorum subsp. camponoti TaxID=1677852 RepID=A0ABR8L6N9_9ACTN|nr:hypothetical protein [Microbispora camponoti]MBD3144173.1 hypothetical protein [Microbispora camponoti]